MKTVPRHVVVVGAGMGGLSAAIAIAARGVRVTVFEAGPDVGGKVGEIVVDGVACDTGPSVLTLPEILDEVLQHAGMSVQRDVGLVSPSPSFRYRFPSGRVLDVHVALEDTLASVARTFGQKDADELRAFLDYARGIWETSKTDFVEGPAPTPWTLVRLALTRPLDLRKVDPLSTMAHAVARRIGDPDLRTLLLRYATYNGSDPFTAPATLHCIAHVELALGGFGVRGGMMTVARALQRAAQTLGVTLRTGARVEGLTFSDDGRIAGVRVRDLGHVESDAVVVNADVAWLRELLPSSRRALPPPTAPSMSGATMIVKARRRRGTAARVAHEVLFPADYAAEFDDIFRQRRSPREPTVYVCAQEQAHGRTGWPDHEPLFVMANAPALQDGVVDDGAALLERARARLLRAGLLDDDDEVMWTRTAAGLAERFPGSRGSLYGAASNDRRSAFSRPPNALPIPGLFVASGSAHPGGGVPLCLQSGLLAAHALLGERNAPMPRSP